MDEHRCREDREHRGDLLLSTLANYLRAAGATDPRTVVTAGGHDVEPLAHAASTAVTAESQLWGGVCSGESPRLACFPTVVALPRSRSLSIDRVAAVGAGHPAVQRLLLIPSAADF